MTRTSPECARLAAELHLLRERCGLTLSELATQSPYSRSSWQRYLAGHTLPPWPAVRILCRLAEEPEPQLRALWELADSAWSRRTATRPTRSTKPTEPTRPAQPADRAESPQPADVRAGMPTGEPPPMPAPVPPGETRRTRKRWTIGIASGAVAVLAGTVLTVSVASDGTALPAPASTGFHVGCTGTPCNGQDPGTALCGVEPQTLFHIQTPAGIGLEIRYNPLCQAAWARVWNADSGDRLTFSIPGRPPQSATVSHPIDRDPFTYTRLVAVAGKSSPLKACVTIGSGKADECYSVPSP